MRLGVFAVSSFLLVGSVWGISHHPARAPQERNAGPVRVSLPLKSWALIVDLPGFTIDTNEFEFQPYGHGRVYMQGENRATGVVFSVLLQDSGDRATGEACERSLQARSTRTMNGEKGKRNVKFSSMGPITILSEDILIEFLGSTVSQSEMFACMPKENVFIDFHLSKMELKPGDEKLFTTILQSVRFEEEPSVAAASGPTAPPIASSSPPQNKQPAQTPSVGSATIKLDDLKLSAEDLPKDCRIIEGLFPVDIQTTILYPQPQAAIPFLPPLVSKDAQSFDCGGEKGTLYFFEFSDATTRKDAEDHMVKPTLWGEEMRPTAMHPERVAHCQNILIVVSFRRVVPPLENSLRARISTLLARDPSSGGFRDVGEQTIANYTQRLSCGAPQVVPQAKAACGWLESFAAGEPPGIPMGTSGLFVGVSLDFDAASTPGRTHYEVLLTLDGKKDRAAFGPIRPDNDDERRDIEALIQAKSSKSEVPKNGAYQYIMQTTPARECKVYKTVGKSLLLFADGVVPVYLRKKGDAIYILQIAPDSIPAEQGQGPFLIGELH